MHISVPVENTIEFINFTQLSPLVSRCQIKVLYISDKPNRNGSIITKDVAIKIGQKLPGSPIVGYYNTETNDYEQHNRDLKYDKETQLFEFVDITKPYGFVPADSKIWLQDFQDDDGEIRTYLCAEGIIWTEAYPESKRILESGNNQSMELHKKTLSGSWTEDLNSDQGFFIINEAIVEKLCILGENVEPCFEGAQIKDTFSLSDAFEELRHSMYSMIQEMSIKGGFDPMDEKDIITQEQQEEVTDFVKEEEKKEEKTSEIENSEDNSDKETSSKNEDNIEDENKKKYNLHEDPEFIDLMNNYQELQASYAALETEKNNLSAEIEPLRAFKLEKEREDKQKMIDSFYMLSDEDKKDVVDNIDTYSLNDIESKLAVICIRNKVSFAEPKENETAQLTYNLNSAVEHENTDVPDWLKAVREIEKKMN